MYLRLWKARSAAPSPVCGGERMFARALATAILVSAAASVSLAAPDSSAIDPRDISVSSTSFNPTLGDKVEVRLKVHKGGVLNAAILDRDGFPVRRLMTSGRVKHGRASLWWDGKDELGQIVPDEAYSLRLELLGQARPDVYMPGDAPARAVKATPLYYDRIGGVFSYELPEPARVHVQAGVATLDDASGKRTGPVLRTLVNREPRLSGRVIEVWNGRDETGGYYVPDLPDFVMAVAATSLPENSIIVTGGRGKFMDTASRRVGESYFARRTSDHGHHQGLSALQDTSPNLVVTPGNASRSSETGRWTASGGNLEGVVTLEGPTTAAFSAEPAKLLVFVDKTLVQTLDRPAPGVRVEVPLDGLPGSEHLVAFNWVSDYGPVAVSSLLVRSEAPVGGGIQPGGRR